VTTASAPPATGASAPLRDRIARLLIVGFRGLRIDDAPWVEKAIVEGGLGGVILFDRHQASGGPRNVESPEQVTRLVADLHALAPDRRVIVSIDQEGGKVSRLSPAHGFPPVASQAAIGSYGDAAVKAWADGLVATLASVGIDLNFAPVVDLNLNPTNPAIGALDRAFAADPAVVSRDAEIEVHAHRERRVRTALKHFPGLGSATTNTDFGVADVTTTWEDIELDPYRDLIGLGLVDAIMAAHVVNGRFDRNAPASLSKATVTGLLREQLGWDGVVVTDDLQAAAITKAFGLEDAVALALEAGNDLLLFANQQVYDPALPTKVVNLVERLIEQGRLTEARIDESVARVDALFRGDRG
jgi:beta-N-acetylhexosaminidase